MGARAARAVLAGLLLLSGAARAGECPPTGVYVPALNVSLSTWMADPVYSSAENRTRITALSGLASRGESGSFTTGLTRTSTNLELRVKTWQADLGDGRRCVGLDRVEGVWKITALTVDIAREYPPGGCQYRVIREHEDEHVAISRDAFRHWTPHADRALREAAARIRPRIVASGADTMTARFKDELMGAMKPTFDAFTAELKTRNGAIDTPANYRRVNGLCQGW